MKPISLFTPWLILLGLGSAYELPAQICNDAVPATTPATELTLNADGTVTHQRTGLIWDRCSWGQSGADCAAGTAYQYNWQQALELAATANSQNHLGHSDWRLPNKNELASLVERHCYEPSINLRFFPNTPSDWFWSSSPNASYSGNAWLVNFANGNVYYGSGKSSSGHVRLVRGGQALVSLPSPNQAPSAAFSLDPAAGSAPLNVSFDASASQDPDGDTLSYVWTSNGSPLGTAAQFNHSFEPGEYSIRLTVSDPDGLSDSVTHNLIVSQRSVGRAVIIAGGGNHVANTLFPYTDDLTQKMYKLLKARGYSDADIVYLTPQSWQDLDLDGLNDNADGRLVDGYLVNPLTELEQAITDIAPGLLPDQQFVLYFHGHGYANPDVLQLNRNTELGATQLASLLGRLPANTAQTIILDACYSGAFLDELRATGRVVISSADASSEAWNTGLASFSDYFMTASLKSMNLWDAFIRAKQLMARELSIFGAQTPWLDDNADGFYTALDGLLAANSWLGYSGVSAAAPPIIDVHPPLEAGADGVLLWAETYPAGPDRISRVRARLATDTGSSYLGEPTDFSHQEVQLSYNATTQRYEALYQDFPQTGLWQVAYQAFDKDGLWSDIAFGEVNVLVGPAVKLPVYRIYAETLGNHFYTVDPEEYYRQIGTIWSRAEGIKFYVPEAAPSVTTPVCRFKKASGVYFYTIKESECEGLRYKLPGYSSEWTYEKDAFHAYLPGQQPADALPVYRFYRYNPLSGRELSHFFTVSATERDGLMNCDGDNAARCAADGIQDSLPDKSNVEFRYEGIAWYMYGL